MKKILFIILFFITTTINALDFRQADKENHFAAGYIVSDFIVRNTNIELFGSQELAAAVIVYGAGWIKCELIDHWVDPEDMTANSLGILSGILIPKIKIEFNI